MFDSICYNLTDREQRQKCDPKSDEDKFLGFSINNRAYRVFIKPIKYMMESINIIFNDVQTKLISHQDEEYASPSQHVVQNIPDNEAKQPTTKSRR